MPVAIRVQVSVTQTTQFGRWSVTVTAVCGPWSSFSRPVQISRVHGQSMSVISF